MKQKSILAILKENVTADSISKTKDGAYIFRREFFYRHGMDANKFATNITAQLTSTHMPIVTQFVVEDSGEHYATFRGGASIAQSSHWWVKVRFNEKPCTEVLK